MSVATGLVLFCIIWALTFFMVNPFWQISQSEKGEVEPGTPASAPVDAMVARKAIVTTVISLAVFGLVFATLEYRWFTLDDVPFLRLPSQR